MQTYKLGAHIANNDILFFFFFFFKILFIFRGEDGGERNINVWLPLTHPPTGDLAHNPGMCPDWESNWRPPGWQANTQPTEPRQPG